jgi:hypothetical protein
MFPRNILTILKASSFLCVLAIKMVYAQMKHIYDTYILKNLQP